MIESHIGEMAALATAICWTFTSMSFESAGKKVGSLAVNYIRLYIGLIFLSVFTYFTRGQLLPIDATGHTWTWLFLSGIVGFAIGDLLLFQAFVVVGARISMLIMSLVPPITALISYFFLGETLTSREIFAMFITVAGVSLVVLERGEKSGQVKFSHPISGILYAFGGAVGQAVGLIFSKYGMGDYSAFAATQIRVIAGIAGFTILFFFMNCWGKVLAALKNRSAMKRITLGSFFGPFLGVSMSLLAVQHTMAGIASTIMAIVPIMIIAPAVIIFKEKVSVKEVIGANIAVLGVTIYFIH
ncbi:DMT family transporter [bacterium]|nr:DMT family transporter [bacterium]MBU1065660.1 DMT family transporter [bacterium]MBU1635814.1 DMT family transporter [bacterium]MBU1875379.1 DMT family transporter [bacterium]